MHFLIAVRFDVIRISLIEPCIRELVEEPIFNASREVNE